MINAKTELVTALVIIGIVLSLIFCGVIISDTRNIAEAEAVGVYE